MAVRAAALSASGFEAGWAGAAVVVAVGIASAGTAGAGAVVSISSVMSCWLLAVGRRWKLCELILQAPIREHDVSDKDLSDKKYLLDKMGCKTRRAAFAAVMQAGLTKAVCTTLTTTFHSAGAPNFYPNIPGQHRPALLVISYFVLILPTCHVCVLHQSPRRRKGGVGEQVRTPAHPGRGKVLWGAWSLGEERVPDRGDDMRCLCRGAHASLSPWPRHDAEAFRSLSRVCCETSLGSIRSRSPCSQRGPSSSMTPRSGP